MGYYGGMSRAFVCADRGWVFGGERDFAQCDRRDVCVWDGAGKIAALSEHGAIRQLKRVNYQLTKSVVAHLWRIYGAFGAFFKV